MRLSKTPSLADRAKELRAEIEQFIDERVEHLRKESPGVPPPVLRNHLMVRADGCLCQAAINIIEAER